MTLYFLTNTCETVISGLSVTLAKNRNSLDSSHLSYHLIHSGLMMIVVSGPVNTCHTLHCVWGFFVYFRVKKLKSCTTFNLETDECIKTLLQRVELHILSPLRD